MALSALVILLSSCAKPPTVPWRAEMTAWFDNSTVSARLYPRRYWLAVDHELLQRRMGNADLVVIARLAFLRSTSRFNQAQHVGLAFDTEDVLYGDLDPALDGQRQLVLEMGPDSVDFKRTIHLQRHMVGTRYLLFLKAEPGGAPSQGITGWEASLWYPTAAKAVRRYAFSLYLPQPELVQELRTMYRDAKKRGPP